MYLDTLRDYDHRRYPARINAALDWLKAQDLDALPDGKYELDDAMYAQIFALETRTREQLQPEAHRDWLDIQYLHQGRETIGFAHDDHAPVAMPYDAARDLIFYHDISGESLLYLTAGQFAVFYPGEIHRPGIHAGDSTIRKIVVKIRHDSLYENRPC